MNSSFHRTRMTRTRNDDGVGLLRLLMLLVVLGAIAAVVAFVFRNSTHTGVVGQCNSDVSLVESAAAAYRTANNGDVPPSVSFLMAGAGNGDQGGPYLLQKPANPNRYTISLVDGNVYVQLNTGDPAASTYGYAAAGITTAVPYDTFAWGGTTAISGDNICAGA